MIKVESFLNQNYSSNPARINRNRLHAPLKPIPLDRALGTVRFSGRCYTGISVLKSCVSSTITFLRVKIKDLLACLENILSSDCQPWHKKRIATFPWNGIFFECNLQLKRTMTEKDLSFFSQYLLHLDGGFGFVCIREEFLRMPSLLFALRATSHWVTGLFSMLESGCWEQRRLCKLFFSRVWERWWEVRTFPSLPVS